MHPMSIFFFNDTATTEIYTLSLHDALPISEPLLRGRPGSHRQRRRGGGRRGRARVGLGGGAGDELPRARRGPGPDRKSTRLNSSHANISYAVFCLKKKKKLHT